MLKFFNTIKIEAIHFESTSIVSDYSPQNGEMP